jgi:DNA processing protein
MTNSQDLAILFALTTVVRLGPKHIAALLLHFGDPRAIWDARAAEIAEVIRLSEDGAERLDKARDLFDKLAEEMEHISAAGTKPISILDERYPKRLQRLPDPPTIIYVRGHLPDPSKTAVAVVGTHLADAEGIADAVAWGKGLAKRDVVVVSGLARGIDGGGHTGALAAEGCTVAVIGSGFDNVYPPEHLALAMEIAENGALISEHPPRTELTKAQLVLRNRIIVALSDAVVVVRLHEDTRGSMEAIRRARDLALPVFLVATEIGAATQRAVAKGAIPIHREPDFDLVLNYL